MNPTFADGARIAVDEVWLDGWHGPTVLRVDRGSLTIEVAGHGNDDPAIEHLGGTVLPGFVDSHVHVGLFDYSLLAASGISGVLDLGSDPATVAGLAAAARQPGSGLPAIEFAGAFLTAPSGYPSDRSWAPRGSFIEVATTAEGEAAVDAMVDRGASVIKISLNPEAGPTMKRELARSIVERAHARGRAVVAHTEGAGQAQRALSIGVDLLSHTPWTERLSDDQIAAHAAVMTWISTLDIHGHGMRTAEFATALDNLARFASAGGRVLYGTDLGNGELPVGLNPRELEALFDAGIELDGVIAALGGRAPGTGFGARFSWTPETRPVGDAPAGTPELVRWLMTASVQTIDPAREHSA